MRKIILLQMVAMAITASHAADLYCASFTPTNQCSSIDRVTNVAAPNEVINVIGQPSTYTDAESTMFGFSMTSQFDYFPTNVFKIFPAATSVYFDSNNFPNLVSNAFDHCSNLNYLSGSNFKFTNLPVRFAGNCSRVTTVTLSNGELATLDVDALEGLTSLNQLSIMFTKITCVPPGFFAHTPKIQTIYLGQNKIVSFDPTIVQGLQYLFFFDLSGNQIKYIPTLDLNNTGTAADPKSLSINFNQVPLEAVDPNFIPTLYTSTQLTYNYLSLSTDQSGNNRCIPDTVFVSVSKENYQQVGQNLTECYNNWTPAIAAMPLPCAPTTTTSTTVASTTPVVVSTQATSPGLTQSPPATPKPCCQQGVLQIILGVLRNATFNVNFN